MDIDALSKLNSFFSGAAGSGMSLGRRTRAVCGMPRAAREVRRGRMEVWIVEERVVARGVVRVSRRDWPWEGEREDVVCGERDSE